MMAFEIKGRDLLARLGTLESKRGRFETPTLLPVINPFKTVLTPKEMMELFNCEAV